MKLRIKRLISLVFTLCIIFCIVPFAFAEDVKYIPPSLKINLPTQQINTHVENTPQYGDELTAEVYPTTITDEQICWYRFYNEKKASDGTIIQKAHYELIGKGRTYTVTVEDLNHCIKCTVDDYSLVKETKPVAKKNYGKPILKVKNNTYYGDTDGCIYFLDQRMQYTHDGINIFDVNTEGSSLLSGQSSDQLDKNGYTWMVRFKGSYLEEESDWVTYTIKPGEKVPVESLSICEAATLTPSANSISLNPIIQPQHAFVNTIDWISSNTDVASVDINGNVTALSNGEATITCIVNKGSPNLSKEYSSICSIIVKDFDKLESVRINSEPLEIDYSDIGNTLLISHEIYPANIDNYTEKWTSSNENVVAVKDGALMPIGEGKATITFSVSQNGITKSDSIEVTVHPAPSVTCTKTWSRSDFKGLEINFTSFPIDNNLEVSVDRSGRETVIVNYRNYTIDGNKLTIDYNYLYQLGIGEVTLNFTMPVLETDTNPISKISTNSIQNSVSTLTYNSFKTKVSSIANDELNYNSLSVKLILLNSRSVPDAPVNLHPFHAQENIDTDYTFGEIKYEVSNDNINVTQYDNNGLASFKITPTLRSASPNVINGTTIVSFYDTSNSAKVGEIQVNVSNFINSVFFTEHHTQIKPENMRKVDILPFVDAKLDSKTSIDLISLKDSGSLLAQLKDIYNITGFNWSVSDPSPINTGSTIINHCEVDSNGLVTANAATQNELYVFLTINQEFTIDGIKYVNTVQTAEPIGIIIKLYKMQDVNGVDHNGQWVALSKVNMNFRILGQDYDPYDPSICVDASKHPSVTIASQSGKKIRTLDYKSRSPVFGYDIILNENPRQIRVDISNKYMRLLPLGRYNITFTFWDSTGTYIEDVVNSEFIVLKPGTVLTGDIFNPTPYILLITISLFVLSTAVIVSKKNKSKYEGIGYDADY